MHKTIDLESRFSLKKPDNYLYETLKSSYNVSEQSLPKGRKKLV